MACAACVLIAWLTQRRRRVLADKSQQVVLASVTFDPDGRFLVTTEGLLPCKKVTRQYIEQVSWPTKRLRSQLADRFWVVV